MSNDNDDIRKAELVMKRNARVWQEAVEMRSATRVALDNEYAAKRAEILPPHDRPPSASHRGSETPGAVPAAEERAQLAVQDTDLAKSQIDSAALATLDQEYSRRVSLLNCWRPGSGLINLHSAHSAGTSARTLLPPMHDVTVMMPPYIGNFTSEESVLFNTSQLAVHSDLTDKTAGRIGAQTRVTKWNDWCQYAGENYEQARNTGILAGPISTITRPSSLGFRALITCVSAEHFFNRAIEPFPARRSNWVAMTASTLMFGFSRGLLDAPDNLVFEANLALRQFNRDGDELPGSVEFPRGTSFVAEGILPEVVTPGPVGECKFAFVGIRQYVRAWGSNIKFDVNAFSEWTVNSLEVGVL